MAWVRITGLPATSGDKKDVAYLDAPEPMTSTRRRVPLRKAEPPLPRRAESVNE